METGNLSSISAGFSRLTGDRLQSFAENIQRGYGVVSFGQRNLPWVLEYIAHQKEHYARSKVVDRLERAEVDDEKAMMMA